MHSQARASLLSSSVLIPPPQSQPLHMYVCIEPLHKAALNVLAGSLLSGFVNMPMLRVSCLCLSTPLMQPYNHTQQSCQVCLPCWTLSMLPGTEERPIVMTTSQCGILSSEEGKVCTAAGCGTQRWPISDTCQSSLTQFGPHSEVLTPCGLLHTIDSCILQATDQLPTHGRMLLPTARTHVLLGREPCPRCNSCAKGWTIPSSLCQSVCRQPGSTACTAVNPRHRIQPACLVYRPSGGVLTHQPAPTPGKAGARAQASA